MGPLGSGQVVLRDKRDGCGFAANLTTGREIVLESIPTTLSKSQAKRLSRLLHQAVKQMEKDE